MKTSYFMFSWGLPFTERSFTVNSIWGGRYLGFFFFKILIFIYFLLRYN